jgi:serine/threonine protein kinase
MTSTRPHEIGQRYVPQRQIGRGGMGAVWLAVDEVLGREVAVKRIGWFPGGGSPGLARAQREAKLAARLNHPHVVAVFDFVSEGDEQWLVMEYVAGTDLAALLSEDGGLPPDDAAALLAEVADALTSAHAAGIVHRDVKPSNILVTPEGIAKLADFGIARARDSTVTVSGLVTGSPAYLAPEVASGSPATEASDVWSLGATLYHALQGRPPYDTTEGVLAAMYRIVHEQPPRLPDSGWPAELLSTTMTTDPDARWSMSHVRDYLASGPLPAQDSGASVGSAAAFAVGSPADSEPGSPGWPVARDDDRRRAWARPLLATTVVLLLALLGGWALVRHEPSPRAGDGSLVASSAGSSGHPSRTPSRTPSKTAPKPTKQSSPPAETPTASAPNASPTVASPTPGPAGTPNAGGSQVAAMRSFVQQYVATALTDPATSWDQLTPRFQQDCCASNEANYAGYWNTIATATLRDIDANPSTMQVRYTITWDPEGERAAEDELVTLGLVRQGGRYLIDYEL